MKGLGRIVFLMVGVCSAAVSGCSGGGGNDLDAWQDTGDHFVLWETVPWGNPDHSSAGKDNPTVGVDTFIGNDPGQVTPSGPVHPNCIDGKYQEPLPKPNMDISGAKATYSSQKYLSFIGEVLGLRYPVGAYLVQGGLANSSMGHCVDQFLQSKSSADAVIGSLSTLVHECGHFYDMGSGGFNGSAYILTDQTQFVCSGGQWSQFGGKTFSRSLIRNDQWQKQWPPCGGLQGDCDFYADVYLDGDPDNGVFEGGDQGFDSVLEETLQYVNSLATGYAFYDHYQYWVTERDGILTFLWYLERYLHLARTQYPAAWNFLTTDPCWQEAILSVWGRAWIFLSVTENLSKLGIHADEILALVLNKDLLNEIALLRQAAGCG